MNYATHPTLTTLWQTRHSTPPTATVSVRNLTSIIQAADDAWGRPNRPQPIQISVSVTLPQSFSQSRQTDQVAADTVHYGLLSKAVLATLNQVNLRQIGSLQNPNAQVQEAVTARGVLDRVWAALTGVSVDGWRAGVDGGREREESDAYVVPEADVNGGQPFLNMDYIRTLEVSLMFPKASLSGDGVSLTAMAVFHEDAGKALRSWRHGVSSSVVRSYAVALKIHSMKVPTLIGINDNERWGKQTVVADVEIERYDVMGDSFAELEKLVYKTMHESSYGTLETLAEKIGNIIKRQYRPREAGFYDGPEGWQVKISLWKPSAVPMAETAGIEYIA